MEYWSHETLVLEKMTFGWGNNVHEGQVLFFHHSILAS